MRANCRASGVSVRLLLTTFAATLLAAVFLPAPAFGQTAYFSVAGDFGTAGDELEVLFNLTRSVSDSETLRFETFASSGGTNAAGNMIADGPGDSVLRLLDSSGVLVAEDDDRSLFSRDALIGFNDGDTPLPSLLGADNYRLQLSDFDDDTDPFALDVVGPADALVPLSISRNVSSLASLSSLTIGTTGAGSNRATFFNISDLDVENLNLESGSTLTQSENNLLVDAINLADGGELEMAGGSLVARQILLGSDGRLNVDGELRVSGNPINGPASVGTLSVGGTGAVVDIDGLLTVLAGGDVTSRFDGEIRANGGISVNTGGTLMVTDSGNLNTNGNITVDGGEFNHHNTGLNLLATGRNLLVTNDGLLRTTGSRLFFDGQRNATLNSGADWTHTGELIAGSAVGSGSITVDGIGSTLVVNGDITVNNNGAFAVRNSGNLDANGDITVDGGTLRVDNTGQSPLASGKALLATNGGQVNTTATQLAIHLDQTATITGGADWDHTGIIFAGTGFGDGTITVSGTDSTLDVTGDLEISVEGNQGVVNILNNAQATSGSLFLARSFPNSTTDATLNVNTSGGLTTGGVFIGQNDGNQGTGTINLAGTGSTITQTGASQLRVGNPDTPGNGGAHAINVTDNAVFTTGTGLTTIRKTGTLNVNTGGVFNALGDFTTSGTVGLELDDATSFTTVDVAGTATLGGTLELTLSDGSAPAASDSFVLIDAVGGVTGTFDTAVLPTLGGGLTLDLVYEAQRVLLEVGFAGDYNADGMVDAADYTVWRDGDSPDSSQAGYDLWSSNYGRTAPAPVPSAAVPEPSAYFLLLLAAMPALRRRSRS